MSKARNKQKQAEQQKMIKSANAKHDLQFGSTPTVLQYAKHVAGRKDLSQRK